MSDEEIKETKEEKPKRARRSRKSKVRTPKEPPPHFYDDGDSEGKEMPSTFTAILQTSHSYQLAGHTFYRNVAKENLPMSLYEKIKNNGNFIIP